MHSVVFICTGNLCRSPMAEGILKARLKEIGRGDIVVSSMGIYAKTGQPASSEGIAVCAENNVDITGHCSRPLAFEELRAADMIFVMEAFQKEFIRTFVPQVADAVYIFGSWPGGDNSEDNMPDPFGRKIGEYRKTYRLIAEQIDRILPFMLAELS